VEFMPEVRTVAGPKLYNELVKKYLEPDVRHQWFIQGMSKEQIDKIRKYYEERYGGTYAK